MGDITITKTSVEDFGTETFEITVPTYENLSIKTGSPVFVQALPEFSEEKTIIIKVEGNVQRIGFSFKIVPLTTDLVTSGLTSGINTKTVENQMGFLLNEFRSTSIKNTYNFSITEPAFSRNGILESLDVIFPKEDPINPICNMSFVVGDVLTTIDKNVPQRPPESVSSSDSGSDIRISWNNVLTADEGGSSITGYKIERRTQIGSWEELTDSATSPYDDTTVTSGAIYKYRVSAVNSQGTGVSSKVVKHTAP